MAFVNLLTSQNGYIKVLAGFIAIMFLVLFIALLLNTFKKFRAFDAHWAIPIIKQQSLRAKGIIRQLESLSIMTGQNLSALLEQLDMQTKAKLKARKQGIAAIAAAIMTALALCVEFAFGCISNLFTETLGGAFVPFLATFVIFIALGAISAWLIANVFIKTVIGQRLTNYLETFAADIAVAKLNSEHWR